MMMLDNTGMMMLDNTGSSILMECGMFINKYSYCVTVFNKKKSWVVQYKIKSDSFLMF